MDVDLKMSTGSNSSGDFPFMHQQPQQQQQLQPGAPPPPAQPIMGFMVPGGAVRTDFMPTDAVGSKFTLTLTSPGDLPSPLSSVSDVVCFIVPNAPLPPDHGILIYWQASVLGRPEPATGFELLGALTPSRLSGVFRTNFSQHEELSNLQLQQQQQGATGNTIINITLGLSVEPLANVQNLSLQHTGSDDRLFVAEKIANDLFNFMKSFDTGTSGSNTLMTVPTNIFDRWLKRFKNRFERDPNFFLKSSD